MTEYELPESCNREYYSEKLRKNQEKLMERTIKMFIDKMEEYIEKCSSIMILTFPKELWQQNRVKIAKMYYKNFGQIYIIKNNKYAKIHTCITVIDEEDIPQELDQIKIELSKR